MAKSAPESNSTTAAVDLWIFPLDATGRLTALALLLSPDERARADRFVDPDDGAQFTIGRALLRSILASYVAMPANAIAFAFGPQGKPTLAEPRQTLHFNLSHSGELAALAVSRDADIGIDIEKIRPIEQRFTARFFSDAENAAISALPQPDQRTALFRCWSRKEAVLKTLGKGLLGNFKSFDVSVGEEASPSLSRLEEPWAMKSFTPADGYVGAVAVRAAGIALTVRKLSEIWP